MLVRWMFVWSLLLSTAFALEIHDISQDWRAEVIKKELAPFHEMRLTENAIENYKRNSNTYLYRIQNNQLVKSNNAFLALNPPSAIRERYISEAIDKILAVKALPDMVFLVDLADYNTTRNESKIPILTFSKPKDQIFDVLMPDFEMLGFSYHLYSQVLAASHKYSWHNKLPIAFWRGSTTGGNFNISTWREYPRSKLVLKTKPTAGLVNARFTNYCQGAGLNSDFLAAMRAPAPHISIPEHLQFKYLIDIDGNASTYSRYFWILLSNSMPLKVTSDFKQWYYDGLEPYKHYVPVASDVSDIVEKIHWAIANDDAAYYIAMESQQFAMQYLHEDSIYSYLYHLLLAYSELFEE